MIITNDKEKATNIRQRENRKIFFYYYYFPSAGFLFFKKKASACTTRPAQTLWKSPERQEEEEGRVGGTLSVCVYNTHTRTYIYIQGRRPLDHIHTISLAGAGRRDL
jgi:hypothetical protein